MKLLHEALRKELKSNKSFKFSTEESKDNVHPTSGVDI